MTETPAQAPAEEAPKSLVQQLADLIDAYATAKMTGNETLVKIAVGPLQQFLQSVDVVPKGALNEPAESVETEVA